MHMGPAHPENRPAKGNAFLGRVPRKWRGSAPFRLVRLSVLLGLSMYLPLEAFDGDADEGLADAVIETPSFRSGASPQAYPTVSPPNGRELTSIRPTWQLVAIPLPEPANPVREPIVLLRKARLCARSRIPDSIASSGLCSAARHTDPSALPANPQVAERALAFVGLC